MTDERRTTPAPLPGEPAGWRATLRDLLRHLRAASPDREATLEWLHEAGPSEADAADQLAFLEAAGLVAVGRGGGAGEEGEEGPSVRPGSHGREFLDTHDEGVLYAALTGAAGGLGTLLESLAVRPLTDVELRDLLEYEYGVEVPDDEVRAHRQWLQALGYVESDDGVTDLTRAGRRRVETDDDLTPPRANSTGEPATAGDAPSSEDSGATGDPRPGGESQSNGEPESPDDAGFASLKRRYDHTCMVCGDRRRRSPEEGYALVHRPMPSGDGHGGPAEPANAVVVCPNHRADFAHGLLRIDPRTHEIEHAYETDVSGRTLATVDGHDLGAQFLAYHNEVVADF